MKESTRILTVLGMCFSILVTLLVLDLVFEPTLQLGYTKKAFGEIIRSPYATAALGVLIFAIMLAAPYTLLRLISARYYRKNISIGDEKGTTVVSLPSIEAILQRTLEAEEDIRSAHVNLWVTKKKKEPLACEITINLYEQENITTRTTALREIIKKKFSSVLQLEYTINPVMTIKFTAKSAAKEAAAAEPAPQFLGPQYPVEPEDTETNDSL